METQILPANHETIEAAYKLLRAGSLAAFPTDTVYGLGAWFSNAEAIEALYHVKGREAAKAIAVLIGNTEGLTQVSVGLNWMAERLAQAFWPGPLTLVVPRHPSLPGNLSPLPTVGVRMPAHPVTLELLNRTGPLAVTSANLSGQPSATTAQEVFDQLSGRIPLILDGSAIHGSAIHGGAIHGGAIHGGAIHGGSLPSTVVDCTGTQPVILRSGPISLEQIQAVLD
jgi:tRNA threonylcarbamoyl adenosine modification protein (Sua5/YciO/YrdC/YwlC family)